MSSIEKLKDLLCEVKLIEKDIYTLKRGEVYQSKKGERIVCLDILTKDQDYSKKTYSLYNLDTKQVFEGYLYQLERKGNNIDFKHLILFVSYLRKKRYNVSLMLINQGFGLYEKDSENDKILNTSNVFTLKENKSFWEQDDIIYEGIYNFLFGYVEKIKQNKKEKAQLKKIRRSLDGKKN